MIPIITSHSLTTLSFADYKKGLKKDKKWLNKATGILFIQDHEFSDQKKGLGLLLYKKEKDLRVAFKEFKKKVASNKLAAGLFKKTEGEEESSHLEIKLILGSLTAEKIKKKGKPFFKSCWGLLPTFTQEATTTAETSTSEEDETINRFQSLYQQLLQNP